MAGIVVALIPAKSNSRRLPGKNMLSLGDTPLFVHSIIVALASKKIDLVVVSSDSPEILEQAEKYGAVALQRPIELCGDDIPNFAVCQNVIDTLEKTKKEIDTLILLQPTHPFRDSQGIDDALEQFTLHSELDSLVSVTKVHRLIGDVTDKLWSTNCQQLGERAQVQNELYEMTGHIFILNVNRTIKQDMLLGEHISPWLLPETWFDIDIDTPFDFMLAESIVSNGCCQGPFNTFSKMTKI